MFFLFYLLFVLLSGNRVLGVRFNKKTWYSTEIYEEKFVASEQLTVDSKFRCAAIATNSVNDSTQVYCSWDDQCIFSSEITGRKTVKNKNKPYYTCKTLNLCNLKMFVI